VSSYSMRTRASAAFSFNGSDLACFSMSSKCALMFVSIPKAVRDYRVYKHLAATRLEKLSRARVSGQDLPIEYRLSVFDHSFASEARPSSASFCSWALSSMADSRASRLLAVAGNCCFRFEKFFMRLRAFSDTTARRGRSIFSSLIDFSLFMIPNEFFPDTENLSTQV
jgi:hypothetical protein